MIAWLTENIATVLICLVVAAILAGAVISIIRNKKKGGSSCGCGCSSCPMSSSCHGDKK